MNWISNYDLFLFDLDGLLVDTEKLHFEAYKRLCSRFGYELAWDFMATFRWPTQVLMACERRSFRTLREVTLGTTTISKKNKSI